MLVELMVGIVVALLVALVAMASAMSMTASQRQGVAVGSALLGAQGALSAVKSEIADAGLGFFGRGAMLCQRLNLSSGEKIHFDGDDFVPLLITKGGEGDQLDVWAASDILAGAAVQIKVSTDAIADVALQSFLPASPGSTVLVAPATPGDPCLVRSVTGARPASAFAPLRLDFGADGRHNRVGFNTATKFDGEQAPQYGSVSLLGTLRWLRLRRLGEALVVERPLDGSASVLARNVVSLRIQYGVSSGTTGEGGLSKWQDASDGEFTKLNSSNLRRVRAVRIGIAVRSPQAQKPDSTGGCDATDALPSLFGSPITSDVKDWTCYRHAVAEVVIPLRNFILGYQ